jgi:pimeloyl-ACP methyl ester carboxylesterase
MPLTPEETSHEPYAFPGTIITETFLQTDEHACIRVLFFQPPHQTGEPPLVLVPGLSSVIASFRGVMREITRTHPVIYVETREKPSSKTSKSCRFDVPAMASDVDTAINSAGLRENGYLLAGFSLGAAAIMEVFDRLSVKPSHIILAEPVPMFRIPIWSLPLAHSAPVIFPLLRPFAKWYMRNFMIDVEKDPEIMEIVERAIDHADPFKLGRTILSVRRFQAWEKLSGLDRPTLIIATSSDTLHHHADIQRMKTLIPDCNLVDLVDNKRTHSAEMGTLIRAIHRYSLYE